MIELVGLTVRSRSDQNVQPKFHFITKRQKNHELVRDLRIHRCIKKIIIGMLIDYVTMMLWFICYGIMGRV